MLKTLWHHVPRVEVSPVDREVAAGTTTLVDDQPARRRSARIHVRIPIEIVAQSEGAEVSYKATTVDFSPLGARIRGSMAFLSGGRVKLVAGQESSESWPCRVAWMAAIENAGNSEVGLEFLRHL
ncbi:MAG TPA: PilZ domain-containing protein [Terriglobia bacterium]|nr:PilZ domain-containing protein [Terriglobia bacterium]